MQKEGKAMMRTGTKRKRWIIGIAMVIIIVILGLFWRIGYVPVLGDILAEHKVSRYAETIYGTETRIKMVYDPFFSGKYIQNGKPSQFEYDLKQNRILDKERTPKEVDAAYKQFEIVKANLPDDLTYNWNPVIYWYADGTDFSIVIDRFDLYGVYSSLQLTPEESMRRPAEIMTEIISGMGDGYQFRRCQFIYEDSNGVFQINFSADHPEELTFENLLNHTEQLEW